MPIVSKKRGEREPREISNPIVDKEESGRESRNPCKITRKSRKADDQLKSSAFLL